MKLLWQYSLICFTSSCAEIYIEERQAKVKELHLRKTDIFMDLIKEGSIPLRPGVLRIIDDAIETGLKLAGTFLLFLLSLSLLLTCNIRLLCTSLDFSHLCCQHLV